MKPKPWLGSLALILAAFLKVNVLPRIQFTVVETRNARTVARRYGRSSRYSRREKTLHSTRAAAPPTKK